MITLDQACEALNLEDISATTAIELQQFIDAATIVVEDVVGPVNGVGSFTEQHRPDGCQIALRQARPVTFTSVKEYVGSTAYTLALVATPDVATAYSFTVDAASSVITRRSSGGAETDFGDEVWVTYTAGLAAPPENIVRAMCELVASSYGDSQQAGHPAFGGGSTGPEDQLVATPSGFLIPYRVMAWLEPTVVELGGFA